MCPALCLEESRHATSCLVSTLPNAENGWSLPPSSVGKYVVTCGHTTRWHGTRREPEIWLWKRWPNTHSGEEWTGRLGIGSAGGHGWMPACNQDCFSRRKSVFGLKSLPDSPGWWVLSPGALPGGTLHKSLVPLNDPTPLLLLFSCAYKTQTMNSFKTRLCTLFIFARLPGLIFPMVQDLWEPARSARKCGVGLGSR